MKTSRFGRLARHAISAVMSISFLLVVPNTARAQAALTAFWTGRQEVVAYAAYGGGLNILYYSNGWREVFATQGYPIGSPLASYFWTGGGPVRSFSRAFAIRTVPAKLLTYAICPAFPIIGPLRTLRPLSM